ncbi:MAG: class IV adenylate cyclase [Planctomycetaceae bacterium]|jgi:adenylate cyclase class 2|nr:class IV adenylate cyclase [Planctomycetaceae bacterium]
MYEVEAKFRVPDVNEFQHRLHCFGCPPFGSAVEETDWFFAHPSKDFRQSDECLRLRCRFYPNGETERFLTYKGPKIDSQTKTRKEIEIQIPDSESTEQLLTALGFRQAAAVRKYRQRTQAVVEGREIEITLDVLPDLPEAVRTFAELETMSVESEWESGKALILDIAAELGLTESVRTSYLHLCGTSEPPR